MCGIAGALRLHNKEPVDRDLLISMVAMLRHRGPDEFGLYQGREVGLGNARLSIIDIEGGQQPISNETRTLWIVFNGEIFNYVELRERLKSSGHRFSTTTDTEVIVHLYEEHGEECLKHLNGQFAFALWDSRSETLFMARDRLGIRPLFYTIADGTLYFASEIKALLAAQEVRASLDPQALAQVFTFWSPSPSRTIFQGIRSIPPGHIMRVRNGRKTIAPYWRLHFPQTSVRKDRVPVEDRIAELHDLLVDAARIRLRADVPVGSYLSGGLDSSAITALILRFFNNRLRTFSVSFEDAAFDESFHQRAVVRHLDTEHEEVLCTMGEIGRRFPDVIWHGEAPILRTAPAPLLILSGLVRRSGYKVILTGEGADEMLCGYNIFKESKVRRLWAREPNSKLRPLLLRRLYPYLAQSPARAEAYMQRFFAKGLQETNLPHYSHYIRWENTKVLRRLFSRDLRSEIEDYDPVDEYIGRLPDEFDRWEPLAQAQYIEITLFMSEYLLCSQGDRMAMANSVEGRFPFLDHRVVEYCSSLPPRLKLLGLHEKYILKEAMKEYLPTGTIKRPKQPYRAPIHHSFFRTDKPGHRLDYIDELLSPASIASTGCFQPEGIERLVKKCKASQDISERDNMALAGVLSTQLIDHLFLKEFRTSPAGPDWKWKIVVDQNERGAVVEKSHS